uniref:Putative gamma-interferon inducible lysosomal thiol reductase-like protein n=1 Tax=Lutzomyia longipalpis TaxID=7200 RepID=A0A1B0CG20_LUTLO
MMLKLLGLFGLFAMCSAQAKVPVFVYYESLCPDSQAFVTQQLYPAMKGPLGKFVDLKLVPFGKSNYTTLGADVQFTCHHGPNECYGNKIQACAIEHIQYTTLGADVQFTCHHGPNECYGNKIQACAIEHIQVNSYQHEHTRESLTLEYINCLMKVGNNFPDSIYPGEKCARQTGVPNWENIERCANTTEGSKVLQRFGDLTNMLQPGLSSVPTVTFRQKYDIDAQRLAIANFGAALCKKISTPTPIECSNIPGAAAEKSSAVLVTIGALILSRFF